jgi:hypothetical protein
VAAVVIKGNFSSTKPLFLKLNQGKHSCIMAKENKHKVKTRSISFPKYVSSDHNDDDASPFPNGLNEKRVTKKLGKELVTRDQLLKD